MQNPGLLAAATVAEKSMDARLESAARASRACMSWGDGCLLSRVVTFDSPGVPKYWRNKAKGLFTSDTYWKEHVQDYLTFPNPINTTLPHIGNLVRLELETHNS